MSAVSYLVFLCLVFAHVGSSIASQKGRLDIGFLLYTRGSRVPQLLAVGGNETLDASHYNGSRRSIFIIHGFLDNFQYTSWGKMMTKELLRHADFNVILVDWSIYSRHFYTEVVDKVPLIAKEVANLIEFLQDATGTNTRLFHIIGHSLGAHVAGYVGKFTPNLGRITGLDPAGPSFYKVPASQRLDKSDAHFVDVIHTDAAADVISGLGTNEVLGHADFYPNSGNGQPGCAFGILGNGLPKVFFNILACDHSRVVDLFIFSINNRHCQPVGINCRSWRSFRRGRCGDCGNDGSRCAKMGFHSVDNKAIQDGSTHIFFLKTTGYPPYCYNHYQIKLELAQPSNQTVGISGLYLVLRGSKTSERVTLAEGFDVLRGSGPFPYLMTTEEELGEIMKVEFRWVDDSYYHYPPFQSRKNSSQFYLRRIRISPISSRQSVYYFCSDPEKALISNQKVVLNASASCKRRGISE